MPFGCHLSHTIRQLKNYHNNKNAKYYSCRNMDLLLKSIYFESRVKKQSLRQMYPGKMTTNNYKQESPRKSEALSGKRDSNSRPQPWQGCALPTELFPQKGRSNHIITAPPPKYPGRDLNPHGHNGHWILSPTCLPFHHLGILSSGKRDSNSRPQPWQGCALPTELFPHSQDV